MVDVFLIRVFWFCSSVSDRLLETRILVGSDQLPSVQAEGTNMRVWVKEQCGKVAGQNETEIKRNLFLQVSVLCNLFSESRSDRQSKEVLGEITDYNKRYSGARRRVSSRSMCSTDFNPELKEVRYEITVTSDSFIVIITLHTCRGVKRTRRSGGV